MTEQSEIENQRVYLALEKQKNKYQLILAIVSGFFATGLAAILVFLVDVMKENNKETEAGRQFSAQYAPQIVSGEVEDRLRVAEFWSRISETEKERKRWKDYERHLQNLVVESKKAQEERDNLQAQIEELRAKADSEPENVENAETIDKLQSEYVKAVAVATNSISRLEQRKPNALTPRIYVHINSESQRVEGNDINKAIEDGGLGAKVAIEFVGPNRSPKVNEFRYFRRSEEIIAREIHQQLTAQGYDLEFKYVAGFENANIRDNHFEVWLKNIAVP